MTTPTHPADLLTFSDASEDEIREAIAQWSWATGVASVTPILVGTKITIPSLENSDD